MESRTQELCTAVGRKLYLGGGGGHDKEKFVGRHYFFRLQKQFPQKWGAHAPPPVPTGTALVNIVAFLQRIHTRFFYKYSHSQRQCNY